MKEKRHQSSPPPAPRFRGGEAVLKPENNGATFPSFLLAKVKDLPAEVSTLGKPLNEKPQANKASLCAFKHHVRLTRFPTSDAFPNLRRSCPQAELANLSPQQQVTPQIPDRRQRPGRAGAEGCLPALDHARWGSSGDSVLLSGGAPLPHRSLLLPSCSTSRTAGRG